MSPSYRQLFPKKPGSSNEAEFDQLFTLNENGVEMLIRLGVTPNPEGHIHFRCPWDLQRSLLYFVCKDNEGREREIFILDHEDVFEDPEIFGKEREI